MFDDTFLAERRAGPAAEERDCVKGSTRGLGIQRGQWVDPAKALETSEIGVVGVEGGLVFG